MASRANDYCFVTRWRVEGTREEVAAVLGDAADLVRWWPSVYLDVRVREPGTTAASARWLICTPRGSCPTRCAGPSS